MLAQVETAAELSAQQLGAFAIALAITLAVIAWLVKDRARIITDRDAERTANRSLSDRLVDQAERMIPVLDRGARAIEDAVRTLDRQDRAR